MSRRPEGTKQGVQQDDSRRRREEKSISLRKDKKEEGLSKRRNMVTANSAIPIVLVATHGGGTICILFEDLDPDDLIKYCVRMDRDIIPYDFTLYESVSCAKSAFLKSNIMQFLEGDIDDSVKHISDYSDGVRSIVGPEYSTNWKQSHLKKITHFKSGQRFYRKLYGPSADHQDSEKGNIICINTTITIPVINLFPPNIFINNEVRSKCIDLFTALIANTHNTVIQNHNLLGDPIFNKYIFLFLWNEDINKETPPHHSIREGHVTPVYDEFMHPSFIITAKMIKDKLNYISNYILNPLTKQTEECNTIPFVIYQSMIIAYIGKCKIYDFSCDDSEFDFKINPDNTTWKAINENKHTRELNYESKVKLFANTLSPWTTFTTADIIPLDPSFEKPLEFNAFGIESNKKKRKKKRLTRKERSNRQQNERSNRRQNERNSEIKIRRKKTRKLRKTR